MKTTLGTIAIDFDGVIHSYEKGWDDGSIYGHLVPGAKDFIFRMQAHGYAVFILSTRPAHDIVSWMRTICPELDFDVVPPETLFWNSTLVVGVTDRKLPALLYIDDRAVRYDGSWARTSLEVNNLLNRHGH
jgi:hypothetical protein